MRFLLSAVLAAVAFSETLAAAVDAMTTDPTVILTGFSTRQRYPWNGKVDIDFSFSSTIPEAFAFVQFKASYKDADGNTVDVPMKTFDQFTTAFCTNAGSYRVTWDSTADNPSLVVTNLKYEVTVNMAKYMVVDLAKGLDASADDPYPVTYLNECPDPTREDGGWTDDYKTTKMVFRLVQPQTFKKGWGNNAFRDWWDYGPGDQTLTRPFYIGVFEVTQGQAKRFYSSYSSANQFTGGARADARPVGYYSYYKWRGDSRNGYCWPNDAGKADPTSLVGQFRARTGQADCEGFDLPTETEWECAARAGDGGAWYGDGWTKNTGTPTAETGEHGARTNTVLNVIGRYKFNGGYVENADGSYSDPPLSCDESHGPAAVGSYKPNAWGLYDVLGNVAEWVLDVHVNVNVPHDVDCVGSAVSDASANSSRRVRGGGYGHEAKIASYPYRNSETGSSSSKLYGARFCWHFPYAPKLPAPAAE